MAEKVKLWFDADADYLEVQFREAPGFMRPTAHDAVMERVDEQGHVRGFSVLGMGDRSPRRTYGGLDAMQPTQIPQADRSPGVEPPIRHAVPWRVVSVTAVPDRQLKVTFVDGTTGDVDLRNFLDTPHIRGTVFEPLCDPAFFAQVRVAMGAVQWPSGADLAPDAMYDAIKLQGRWVVE